MTIAETAHQGDKFFGNDMISGQGDYQLLFLFWEQRALYLKQVRMTQSINTPEMLALICWLRKARTDKGLTMRDLAIRLGKSHTYVHKVETGERRLDVVEYAWYCQALNVAPEHGLNVVLAALHGRTSPPQL